VHVAADGDVILKGGHELGLDDVVASAHVACGGENHSCRLEGPHRDPLVASVDDAHAHPSSIASIVVSDQLLST
jgi:hypothetical protein